MKLFLLASVSASIVKRDAEEKTLDGDKRYNQLVDMMTHYNPDFDERKYWAYGCNCLNVGDRAMSDPGYGKPVDDLDAVCKKYKDCVKCAKQEFGEMCIGEFVRYKYGYKNDEVFCKNNANTCERALCECDAMIARDHVHVKDVFQVKYHYFWADQQGLPMWDPSTNEDQCERGGPGNPECCGGKTNAFHIYNQDRMECCADDDIARPRGEC